MVSSLHMVGIGSLFERDILLLCLISVEFSFEPQIYNTDTSDLYLREK